MSCEIQPARHNDQPTQQQGTKWAGKAWPKMNKNANFGPNLVVLGQKVLIFAGEIKRFVTHITEIPPRHLVRIVFWLGMGPNGPKMPKANGDKNQSRISKYYHWSGLLYSSWAQGPPIHSLYVPVLYDLLWTKNHLTKMWLNLGREDDLCHS